MKPKSCRGVVEADTEETRTGTRAASLDPEIETRQNSSMGGCSLLSSLSPSLIFLLLSSLVSLRATVAPLSRPHRRTGIHENGRAPPYRRPSLFLFSSSGSRAPSRTSAVSPLPTMKDHDRPLRFKFLSGWTERRVSRPGNGNLPACGTRRNSSSRRRFDRLRRSTIVLFRFVSHLASFFFFSSFSLLSLSVSNDTQHISREPNLQIRGKVELLSYSFSWNGNSFRRDTRKRNRLTVKGIDENFKYSRSLVRFLLRFSSYFYLQCVPFTKNSW